MIAHTGSQEKSPKNNLPGALFCDSFIIALRQDANVRTLVVTAVNSPAFAVGKMTTHYTQKKLPPESGGERYYI